MALLALASLQKTLAAEGFAKAMHVYWILQMHRYLSARSEFGFLDTPSKKLG
jgi:hypothetical protein